MNQYSTFLFDSYSFVASTGEIELNYSLDGEVKFTEIVTVPTSRNQIPKTRNQQLDRALFALHLIAGTSYYKTCLPKTIEIKSGTLSEHEAAFWNAVYKNGLGEFFYRNQIDFRGLINFPFSHNQKPVTKNQSTSPERETRNEQTSKRVLVPIGGGKDSLVTAELLRKVGHDVTLLRMGSHPIIDELAEISGFPLLTIKRQLSPELFKLNEEGALNDHVPITAYVSIVSVITAMIHGFDAVVMSNEGSASYGNVEYLGQEINHQWSKGLEFELMFQTYLQDFIGTDIEYFSLLRPLTELAVVKRFAQLPQYVELATSCNVNWKISKPTELAEHQRWCGKCPKCTFVFALYAAFLPRDKVTKIFGKDLFTDESLLPLYRQLLAIEGFKPFECVGTPEETLAALVLANERHEWPEDAPVMKMAMEETDMPSDLHALIEQELTPSEGHAIPDEFIEAVLS